MKILKRMTFNVEKTILKNDLRYIVYLKSSTYHNLYSKLEKLKSNKNTLVILDDQIGFHSDIRYPLSFKVKIVFSLKNIVKYWGNPSQISVDFIENILKSQKNKVTFINFNDHDTTTKKIIEELNLYFIQTATVQHGILTDIDGYFPFNTDVFFTISKNDKEIGDTFLQKNQQIVIAGNLMLNEHIESKILENNLLKNLNQLDNKLLIATNFKFKNNIDLIIKSIKFNSMNIFFKPHPSDKLKFVYKLIILYLNLFSKSNIMYISKDVDLNVYSFLLTNHSSMIFEGLHRGVLPIIVNDCTKTEVPQYIEKVLFEYTTPIPDHMYIKDYYKTNIKDLMKYFYKYTNLNNNSLPSNIIEHTLEIH